MSRSVRRAPDSSSPFHASATVQARNTVGIALPALEQLASFLQSVGPPCWATGVTAAALHQFDGYALRPPFHVLVLRDRFVHRVGHAIHSTRLLDPLDRESRFALPVISPSRTLLQLAATEPLDRLTAALDGAIRDGLTTDDFLHRRLASWRASGRNGVRPLIAAIDGLEITRGGHSWLEREFLRLIGAAGLPRPETQAVLGRRGDKLIRVDVRFPGTNLVVELLGYQWHRSKAHLASDVGRLNRLQFEGFLVAQFTYPQVVEQPDMVVAEVVEGLTLASPRPN